MQFQLSSELELSNPLTVPFLRWVGNSSHLLQCNRRSSKGQRNPRKLLHIRLLNFIHLLGDCDSCVVKAKDLASFVSMIISLFPFVGNVAHIMIRSLYQALNCRSSWFSNVQFSHEAIREIMFRNETRALWTVGRRGQPIANPLRLSIRTLPSTLVVLLLNTKVKYFSKTGHLTGERKALLGEN